MSNIVLGNVATIPSKETGDLAKLRLSKYSELYVQANSQLAAAQAGHLWVAGTPTSGTGIASHAAPTATDGTKPVLMFQNNYALGTDAHLFVESIELTVAAQGANATGSRIYVEKSGPTVTRFSSAGSTNLNSTALVANCTGTAPFATSAVLRMGPVVASADAAALLLHDGVIRTTIPKINDRIVLAFGDAPAVAGAVLLDYANAGAIAVRYSLAAVDLAPKETLLVHLVNAAQDAASSYTARVVYRERP